MGLTLHRGFESLPLRLIAGRSASRRSAIEACAPIAGARNSTTRACSRAQRDIRDDGRPHRPSLPSHSRAPVAQLDRASVYGTEGLGFESLRARYARPCEGVQNPANSRKNAASTTERACPSEVAAQRAHALIDVRVWPARTEIRTGLH